jgi:hypothetical protein
MRTIISEKRLRAMLEQMLLNEASETITLEDVKKYSGNYTEYINRRADKKVLLTGESADKLVSILGADPGDIGAVGEDIAASLLEKQSKNLNASPSGVIGFGGSGQPGAMAKSAFLGADLWIPAEGMDAYLDFEKVPITDNKLDFSQFGSFVSMKTSSSCPPGKASRKQPIKLDGTSLKNLAGLVCYFWLEGQIQNLSTINPLDFEAKESDQIKQKTIMGVLSGEEGITNSLKKTIADFADYTENVDANYDMERNLRIFLREVNDIHDVIKEFNAEIQVLETTIIQRKNQLKKSNVTLPPKFNYFKLTKNDKIKSGAQNVSIYPSGGRNIIPLRNTDSLIQQRTALLGAISDAQKEIDRIEKMMKDYAVDQSLENVSLIGFGRILGSPYSKICEKIFKAVGSLGVNEIIVKVDAYNLGVTTTATFSNELATHIETTPEHEGKIYPIFFLDKIDQPATIEINIDKSPGAISEFEVVPAGGVTGASYNTPLATVVAKSENYNFDTAGYDILDADNKTLGGASRAAQPAGERYDDIIFRRIPRKPGEDTSKAKGDKTIDSLKLSLNPVTSEYEYEITEKERSAREFLGKDVDPKLIGLDATTPQTQIVDEVTEFETYLSRALAYISDFQERPSNYLSYYELEGIKNALTAKATLSSFETTLLRTLESAAESFDKVNFAIISDFLLNIYSLLSSSVEARSNTDFEQLVFTQPDKTQRSFTDRGKRAKAGIFGIFAPTRSGTRGRPATERGKYDYSLEDFLVKHIDYNASMDASVSVPFEVLKNIASELNGVNQKRMTGKYAPVVFESLRSNINIFLLVLALIRPKPPGIQFSDVEDNYIPYTAGPKLVRENKIVIPSSLNTAINNLINHIIIEHELFKLLEEYKEDDYQVAAESRLYNNILKDIMEAAKKKRKSVKRL